MNMPTVNVRLDHLQGKNRTPDELLAQIQQLQAAGLRLNLQVQRPDGLALLQQLPEVKKQQQPTRPSMTRLLLLGVLASGASIATGLLHLYL